MADNNAIREGTGKITIVRSVELEGGIHIPVFALADADGNLLGSSSAPLPVSVEGGITIGDITLSNVEISNDVGNPVPISSAQLAALLAGGLPAALGSNGGLKVEANGAKNTATVSRVSASATAVTLLAANANRRRVIIYNDSTAVLRVKLGSAASATDYTYRLGAGDTYESPTDWVYTGIVTGIWDSATGAAQVTEI